MKYFTTKELAERLGVTRQAVFNAVKAGKIRASIVGRTFAIPESELEKIGILDNKVTHKIFKKKKALNHSFALAVC